MPPLLAGDVARAILGGQPFPRSWLLACITRLRAGDDPGAGWHAAAIKACLEPQPPGGEPARVARSRQYQSRLTNSAGCSPRSSKRNMPPLAGSTRPWQIATTARLRRPPRACSPFLRNARNHVADAKRRGGGGWLEKKLDEIMGRLDGDLPRTLRLEDQGRFAVGYYHERAIRPTPRTPRTPKTEDNNGRMGIDI